MLRIKSKEFKEGDIHPGDPQSGIPRGAVYCAGTWWKPWVLDPRKPEQVTPRPLWDIHKEMYWSLTNNLPVPPTAIKGLEGRKYHYMRFVEEIWGRQDSIYPYKWNPIAIEMIEKKLEYNFLMVAGHGGSGKCLAPDTPVLMYDGSIKKAKEVKVGDLLMGDDSTPRRVLGTCSGKQKMYKVHQDNGDDYVVNSSHILSVRNKLNQSVTLDIPIEEFIRLPNRSDFLGFKGGEMDGQFSNLSFEDLGEGDYNGFEVDGNHRFLLGDFTVTHNSRTGALWGISNFLFDPFNTKVLVTSMTLKAAEGKIWGDITEAWQQACRVIAASYGCTDHTKSESYMPGKFLREGIIKYEFNGVETRKAGLELIACDASSAKDSAEKVQGYHRGRVFAILDELATLNHQIMTTIESNIFTNPHADVIGLFNPDSHFDPAGVASAPIGGWNSVDIDTPGWKNRYGYTIRLDGARSPNVVLGYEKYKGLLTKDKYEEAKATKTEKEFMKQYRAWWSTSGTKEAIYTESEIEQYLTHLPLEGKEWIAPPTPVGFLDPSFAHNGDKAALQFGLCGYAIIGGQKKQVLAMGDLVNIDATIDPKLPKVEQLVDQVIHECNKRKVTPKNFGLDTTSGNIELLLARDWRDGKDVLCVNFGEGASDKPISKVDRTPAKEKYSRCCDEIWYGPKPLIIGGHIRGLHPEVIKQMTSRLFKIKNGKISIETKDEMKKRALKSPNEADAALGLIYLCRQRLGLMADEKVNLSHERQNGGVFKKIAKKVSDMSNVGISFTDGGALWD